MKKQLIYSYDGTEFKLLETEKVASTYNHGAGCTFAASVCANLANGLTVEESVIEAKEFVSAAIKHGWALNESRWTCNARCKTTFRCTRSNS